jgi:hypothetical protein
MELAAAARPDDGHLDFLSSCCLELEGILAPMYIIYRICQHCDITDGKATFYCDIKELLIISSSILL